MGKTPRVPGIRKHVIERAVSTSMMNVSRSTVYGLSPDPLSRIVERFWCLEWVVSEAIFHGSWGIEVPVGHGGLYFMRTGRCKLVGCDDVELAALEEGDFVILLQGLPHRLCDRIDSPAVSVGEIVLGDGCATMPTPADGPTTALFFATIAIPPWMREGFERSFPSPIVLNSLVSSSLALQLETLFKLISEERRGTYPGWHAIINRLVQVLFVQGMRSYLANIKLSGQPSGHWLQGAFDPLVSSTIQVIHREPEKPWTVERLANVAQMSRSAFSERFREVVGEAPLQYLTGWRMQKASQMLGETKLSVKEVAKLVGYESVTSFSTIFKRHTGASPAVYRRQRVSASAEASDCKPRTAYENTSERQ
jgi:AraC-like DNA-binding protein